MAVEVKPVTFPKDAVRFCKVWWHVYRDDPHWVPPLLMDRKKFFDVDNHPYYNVADVAAWIAYKDGLAVGTIGVAHDRDLQASMPGYGAFGFFEFIDDEEVASALLETGRAWLKERGLDRMVGPMNWSPNHEFGLLVSGFDTDPLVANPHNAAYYPRIYDAIGLVPNKTYYAYWLDNRPEPPRIFKIVDRVLKRNPGIRVRPVRKKDWENELQIVRDVYNDAWHDNWGHVRVRPEEFDYLAKDMKMLVEEDLCYVVEVDGEVAGVSVTFPDYNVLAKKMNGRLLPFGWWHFVFGKKAVFNQLRVFILGVKQEYQHLPLGALMYAETWKAGRRREVRGVEASLILHDNIGMRGAMEKMGGFVYKNYRLYEGKLHPDAPDVDTDVGELIPIHPPGFTLTPEGERFLEERPSLKAPRKKKKAEETAG